MLASVVVGNLLAPVVMKHVSGKYDRTKQQVITYTTIFLLTLILFLTLKAKGGLTINQHFLPILLAGVANSLAVYCQWRAVDISLAKSSVFTFLDDVIGLVLAALLLGEWSHLNLINTIGIGLSLAAVIWLARRDWLRRRESVGYRLYFFVAVFSLIWGSIIVLMRQWGSADAVPVLTFLMAWYSGSTLGAWGLYFLARRRFAVPSPIAVVGRWQTGFWAAGLGLLVLASTGFSYLTYQRAPLVIVQPIFLVAAMVLPALIGLFFFRERKNLTGLDWFLLMLTTLGGLIVGFSY